MSLGITRVLNDEKTLSSWNNSWMAVPKKRLSLPKILQSNAILSPIHFSIKTGRKGPVFPGFTLFQRGSSEQFYSDSTFFEGLFGVESGRRFPSPPRAGRRAGPCVSRLRAPKGDKNRGRIRVMRHPPDSALRSGLFIFPMGENPGIGQGGVSGNICNFISPNRGKIRVIGSSLLTGFPPRYVRKIL